MQRILNCLRLLLYPLGFLYACIVKGIEWLYRRGWKRKHSYEIPLINIGNISVGGTGKSPHVAFLIEQLSGEYRLAVLSRGYGRKTKDVREVYVDSKVEEVGDEPLMGKRRYLHCPYIVARSRPLGMQLLLGRYSNTEIVLLDDAFQHWAIKASYNIVLTTADCLYTEDYPLPAGRLREFPSAARRADIIIVTKVNVDITEEQAQAYRKRLHLLAEQKLFFSYVHYGALYPLFKEEEHLTDWKGQRVLALSGIAEPKSFEEAVAKLVGSFYAQQFPDHHRFNRREWQKVEELMEIEGCSAIITTEKDAVRLLDLLGERYTQYPIYVLPISIGIAFNQKEELIKALQTHIKAHK